MSLLRASSKLGWPLLVVLCALPVLRWASIEPLADRFATPVMSLLSLGQVAGIIGLTLYAFNLLLSTRLPVFEDLFGGLNKVYIAHHIIGGIALIALLIHPLMLSLRLAPLSLYSAAMLLVPQFDNLPVAFGIFALLGLVALLYITFFVVLPYKLWLMSHKLLGGFFFLAGLHVLLVPSDLYNDLLLKSYMLGFVALGLIAFGYRTLLPRIFVRRYEYSVRSAKIVGENVVQIDMVPKLRAMNFKAGQFIFVSFRHEGMSSEWHPFTVSSAPTDSVLSITVKSLGSYTRLLTRLQAGMEGCAVWVEGAYGRFSFRNFKSPKQVWVAGGIGITPFLSMARDLGAAPCKIDLYYSVRTEGELIDMDLLQQAALVPGQSLRIIPFVTATHGYLTAKYIAETSGGLGDADILLCGPPPMMHSLKDQLLEMGVKRGQVHSEEFSMS